MDISKNITSLPFLVKEFPGGVLLKRGANQLRVKGENSLEFVMQILLKTSGKACVVANLLNAFPEERRTEAKELIAHLLERRFLVDATDPRAGKSPDWGDNFLWQFGLPPGKIREELSALNILLVGENLLALHIRQLLLEMGVENMKWLRDPVFTDGKVPPGSGDLLSMEQIGQTGLETGLILAANPFGGQFLLLPWNRFAVENGIPFYPVLLEDMTGFMGPLVFPGETACLHCLRLRQNSHLTDPEEDRLWEEDAQKAQLIAAVHPAMIHAVAATAVYELAHYFGGLPGARAGRLVRQNLPAGSTVSRRVLKIPRCPTCSNLNQHSPVSLKPLKKNPE